MHAYYYENHLFLHLLPCEAQMQLMSGSCNFVPGFCPNFEVCFLGGNTGIIELLTAVRPIKCSLSINGLAL